MPALVTPSATSSEIPVGSLLMLYAGASNRSTRFPRGRPAKASPPPLLSRLMEHCCAHDSFVADPGCAANVGGDVWLARASKKRGPFRIVEETRDFTFGAGLSVTSIKCVALPCLLAGKDVYIKFSIILGVLPPLLSKPTMKRMGGILNMVTDTLSGNITGSPYSIPLVDSATGHYLVHLPRLPLH